MEPVELIDLMIDFKELKLALAVVEAGNPKIHMGTWQAWEETQGKSWRCWSSPEVLCCQNSPPCSGKVNLSFC